MKPCSPPRLGVWLLQRLVRDEALVGDIIEEFGRRRSQRWFWRQVLYGGACAPADRRHAHQDPLGLTACRRGDEDWDRARRHAINLSASPIPHVGGLGLVALAALVIAIRPQALWLPGSGFLLGLLFGAIMATIRRRQAVAAPDRARLHRLAS